MKILITGGAGFIGSNLTKYHMDKNDEVIVLDNLSRPGVERNLNWLKANDDFEFIKEDVRRPEKIMNVFRNNKNINIVYHQAGQVAVTTSIKNPREDFEVNALGTFNILEAMRNFTPAAILIYSSTNKVYGNLSDIEIIESEKRYFFKDKNYEKGVSENRNLNFHSPYGCSKGAADQYVIDYSRLYGLKTIVFRQSCIYGYRQIGLEDQGWVAWFAIQSLFKRLITIYGTGKQVRDILFIDDLIAAYEQAIKNIDKTAGRAYNLGGGVPNSISLLELIDFLNEVSGSKTQYKFADWREGDQKIFIADTSRSEQDFGWTPKINKEKGIRMLYEWLNDNQQLLK